MYEIHEVFFEWTPAEQMSAIACTRQQQHDNFFKYKNEVETKYHQINSILQ